MNWYEKNSFFVSGKLNCFWFLFLQLRFCYNNYCATNKWYFAGSYHEMLPFVLQSLCSESYWLTSSQVPCLCCKLWSQWRQTCIHLIGKFKAKVIAVSLAPNACQQVVCNMSYGNWQVFISTSVGSLTHQTLI